MILWWLKFCVFRWQSERSRERYKQLTLIFQLAELLEQREREFWNGNELKTEKDIVSTGIFCLTYIDGP